MNETDYKKSLYELNDKITSQDVLDKYGIVEYNASDVIKDFENAMAYKQEQARIFKILDAADHSNIWKIFNRKIPNYVQTPENNIITIIKEASKASIMPTSYAGEFIPLTLEAKTLTDAANRYFEMKWENAKMDEINSAAADYAFLHGTSGVLFGWNDDIVDSTDIVKNSPIFKRSELQAKACHPSNIFPDPSANSVDEMRYLFIAERKSKSFLQSIPRFKDTISKLDCLTDTLGETNANYVADKGKQSNSEVVTFLTCYRRVFRKKIDPIIGVETVAPSVDVIYMAGREILDVSKDIQPNIIPYVTLYDEQIPNNYWGTSKCQKVLSMYLALIQLDSTEATAYFKNQNPAEFINTLSGLNIAEYQNKRGNPDTAFRVNIDPRIVQSFASRPELPKNLDTFRQYLIQSIQQVSGVDAIYLGRNFGSIQTTGGVTSAIDRATLRDNTRIKNIDAFIKKELETIMLFFMNHGKPESFYNIPNKQTPNDDIQGQKYDFDPVTLATRDDILIRVSNCAPRSNASYEDAAMKIMEMQMKYIPSQHGYPDFITPEEFIGWLNIPNDQKHNLIDRMKDQMETMKLQEYTAVVTSFGQLCQGGMQPEVALQEVVKQMQQAMGQLPAANPNPGAPMAK